MIIFQTLTWFPFSLLATLCFGVAMAFYKFPTAKQYSRFSTAFWSLAIPFMLSGVFFYQDLVHTTGEMILFAVLWGVSFPCIMLLQMYALNHIDTNVLFPVTTTASLVVTLIVGMIAFSDRVSLLQSLGILLAVLSIFLFLYKKGKLQLSSVVLWVGSGIIFISAFNKILQKLVADRVDIQAFQVYQYLFATLTALAILIYVHKAKWRKELFAGGLKIGVPIGLMSFFGGYSLLIALTRGPFPVITSIHSLYIFVTAITAYFLFREQITLRKIFLIALAILAVILIRIG